MMIVLGVVAILAIGAVVLVALGRGDALAEAYDDRPDVLVPADGPLTAADLRGLSFSTAVRGYRADEVDALLARLADQLEGRPEE